MPQSSVLSQNQRASLRIEKFIFHVIDIEKNEPIYLDGVRLNSKQRDFFQQRIAAAAEGSQYEFLPESGVKDLIGELLRSNKNSFVKISKKLARDFLKLHQARMSDGIFIVAVVTIPGKSGATKLASAIKMDHEASYQYEIQQTSDGSIGVLTGTENSLVQDKKAIQKSALIDPSSHYKWDVLATDRTLREGIRSYFKKFLEVVARETNDVLTRRAASLVKRWAKQQSELPPGEQSFHLRQRAIRFLEDHVNFDTDMFIDAVVRDDDPDKKAAHEASLKEFLAEGGIAGQKFRIVPVAIASKDKTTKIRTEERVQIKWAGDMESAGIDIRKVSSGGYKIEIRTGNIEDLT